MRRTVKALRVFSVALLSLVLFAAITGARPLFAQHELRCPEGQMVRPVSVAAWAVQCEPVPLHVPMRVNPPRTATTQDEVGLYLTNLQVRVFHIDFVAGTYHGLALGVPLTR
jgi:hypothetical protein